MATTPSFKEVATPGVEQKQGWWKSIVRKVGNGAIIVAEGRHIMPSSLFAEDVEDREGALKQCLESLNTLSREEKIASVREMATQVATFMDGYKLPRQKRHYFTGKDAWGVSYTHTPVDVGADYKYRPIAPESEAPYHLAVKYYSNAEGSDYYLCTGEYNARRRQEDQGLVRLPLNEKLSALSTEQLDGVYETVATICTKLPDAMWDVANLP